MSTNTPSVLRTLLNWYLHVLLCSLILHDSMRDSLLLSMSVVILINLVNVKILADNLMPNEWQQQIQGRRKFPHGCYVFDTLSDGVGIYKF